MKISERIKTKKLSKPANTHWFVFLFVFLSLISSFFVGYFSPETMSEDNAHYIANVVNANTTNSRYLGVIVQEAKERSIFSAVDNDAEFRRVYGIFRQERATFAAGYNLDKKHDVEIDILKNAQNQSIMYIGPSSSIKYGAGYKHNPYPYIFMFPLVRDESLTKNCLSISKSSATKYLLDMFPSKKESDLTSSDYQTYVIGASAKVTIDGFDDEYTVQNIYLDDENADYYYDCIKETVGDFVIFSEYFYPKSSENTYLDSQRMYYFTEYTYQNKYFINYLNDLYSTSNYVFFVSKNNLVNQNFDLDKVLAFRQPNFSKKSNVVETILLIVTITFAFLSIGSFIVFNVLKNDLSFALCVFTVFVPFIFFRLFYLITNNVFLFSYVGTKTCGIIMIIYLLLAIIAYVSKKIYVRKNEKHIEKIEI